MFSLRLLSAIGALFIFSIELNAQKIGDRLPQSRVVIAKGIDLFDKGEIKQSIDEFLKVPESDTLYSSAMYELALAYQADSAYDKALATLDKYIAIRTTDKLGAICMKGSILDKMGKSDEAIAAFEEAARLYGHSYRPYYEKSVTEVSMKKYAEAYADLEKSLLRNPLHLSTHVQIALLAYDAEEYALFQMASFFSAMLTPSENQDLMLNCLQMIENQIGGKMEKAYNGVPTEIFSFAENLQAIDEILYSGSAVSDRYKSKVKGAYHFSKQMQALCEQLGTVGKTNNPVADFYINFYKTIWERGLFVGMIAKVCGAVDDQNCQNIANKYKSDAAKFNNQVFPILTSSFSSFNYTNYLGGGVGKPVFENGQVLGIVEEDDKGNRNGGGCFFYSAGEVKSKGGFKNNKLEGKWIGYYDNGVVKTELNFSNGLKNGEQIEYYSNGMMALRSSYKDDKQIGLVEEFQTDGFPMKTYELNEKGQLVNYIKQYDGHDYPQVEVEFSAPDKMSKAIYYKGDGTEDYSVAITNNELNGKVQSHNVNGVLVSKGELLKGEKHGFWQFFSETGQLTDEGEYENGYQTGEWKEFYENGSLASTNNYKNGKLDGLTVHYDRLGKKLSEINYRNGRFIELRYLMPDGTVFHESKTVNGVHNVVTYSDLRYKKSEGLLKNEKREGEWKFYSANGTLESITNYKADEPNGFETHYHTNGDVKAEYYYENGVKQGFYRQYRLSNVVSEEGYFEDGNIQGMVKQYNPDGSLSQVVGVWKGDYNGPQRSYIGGKETILTNNEFGLTASAISYNNKGEVVYVSELDKYSGVLEYFSDKGFRSMKVTVERDRYVGISERYNADGTVTNQITWKEGRKNGPYKVYYRSKLIEEGENLDGQTSGLVKFYEDGKLEREINFESGQRNGKMVVYYPSGKVHQERFYRYGERDGAMTYFNEDGTLKVQLNYTDGVLTSYTYPDASGKLKTPIEVKNDSGDIVAYFANGKKAIAISIMNGQYNGSSIEYYPDGKVQMESTFIHGFENGTTKVYYPSGKVKMEEPNVDGFVHGIVKEYYDNGKLKSEVTYTWGERHGPAKFYTKEGKIESQGEFYENGYRQN